jgi:hypothetical protein
MSLLGLVLGQNILNSLDLALSSLFLIRSLTHS